MKESLNSLQTKLIENRFHMVVLGQFKRGKSTFINSILGDSLLPTSVVPLTSIVTAIKYGEREKIEVVFENGSREVISRDELAGYVTERGNPGNTKGVKQEVAFPSEYLKEGVSIIDTPGVGSTFENNTEMTYNFLPNVDAALFLLAVDPPISQSEVAFLKDVRRYVEKIFYIQNKIDYIGEKEREESLHFSKAVIEEAMGADGIRIYPLSARMALEGKQSGDPDLFDFFSQKILPKKLSKKLFLKDLKSKLPQKIDQNCGRVRWDFMERIRKSFLDFRWDLNQKINDTEDNIRKAIDKALELKRLGTVEMEKAQALLHHDLDVVRKLKADLEVLYCSL